MRNLILSVDKLNTFSTCPRKYYFEHELKKTYTVKPKYFLEGEFGHLCLEFYYLDKIAGKTRSTIEYIEHFRNEAIKFTTKYPTYKFEESEEIITALDKYLKFHCNEEWVIEGAEVPFAKVLWQDDKLNLKIIIRGKVDLLVDTKQFKAVVDHKFLGRKKEIPSRDNQKLAYCWAFDRKDFIINVIGKQKTLKDDEKFIRPYFNYSTHQIEEWKEETILTAIEMVRASETGVWQGRYTGCHAFDYKCLFTGVCDTTKDNREYALESFANREDYDVMED